ncbi:hypothetical protein OY671_010477, partial [Metschnikowia pulcherrima]
YASFHQERGKAPPHRARDDGYLCPAGRARGHVRIHARDAVAGLRAARTRSLCHDQRASRRDPQRGERPGRGDRAGDQAGAGRSGPKGGSLGPREAPLFDSEEDGRAPCQLRADHRHHGLPRADRERRRSLQGAGHPAPHSADEPGPVQGLRLHAEDERLQEPAHLADLQQRHARGS